GGRSKGRSRRRGGTPNGATQLRHRTQTQQAETVSPEEVAKAFGQPAEVSDSPTVAPPSFDSPDVDSVDDSAPEPVAAGDATPRRRRRRRASSD
ncbi:MAG: hypothetical protein ACFCBU_04635, partial [Cyanophyceae cyanobacterium]